MIDENKMDRFLVFQYSKGKSTFERSHQSTIGIKIAINLYIKREVEKCKKKIGVEYYTLIDAALRNWQENMQRLCMYCLKQKLLIVLQS